MAESAVIESEEVPAEHCHLPSVSTGMKSLATAVAGSTHPEKSSERRSGTRHSVLWEQLAEKAFRELDTLRRTLSAQFSSVTQSCPTLCDPMNGSTPGLPVHHQIPEFTETHLH